MQRTIDNLKNGYNPAGLTEYLGYVMFISLDHTPSSAVRCSQTSALGTTAQPRMACEYGTPAKQYKCDQQADDAILRIWHCLLNVSVHIFEYSAIYRPTQTHLLSNRSVVCNVSRTRRLSLEKKTLAQLSTFNIAQAFDADRVNLSTYYKSYNIYSLL